MPDSDTSTFEFPDDDYELWCELNPCPECGGEGVIADDGYGDHTCRTCDGSGIDPNAAYDPREE